MQDDVETECLIRRVEGGDQAAAGELIDRHRERLRRMVSFRLDPRVSARVDASDVVQDAMAEASRRLPEYLKSHRATPEMRRARFTVLDRLVLIPVEVVHVLLPMAIAAVLLFFFAGLLAASAAVAAIVAGVVLFPILLPWLPTPDFSVKGFILGAFVALPFSLRILLGSTDGVWWSRAVWKRGGPGS